MEEDKRLITDIAIFFVSVVVMIFWLFTNHINVYENKFIGIIAEVLWLPMILLIFVLPILTFVLVSSRKFKNSKIYAFEPNPSVFKTLATSLKDMKNVILPFNLGISDKKGELEFYKNSNTGTQYFNYSRTTSTLYAALTASQYLKISNTRKSSI